MSSTDAFLAECDDVISDWEGSSDSATWAADGSHEVDTGGHYYANDVREIEWDVWMELQRQTIDAMYRDLARRLIPAAVRMTDAIQGMSAAFTIADEVRGWPDAQRVTDETRAILRQRHDPMKPPAYLYRRRGIK